MLVTANILFSNQIGLKLRPALIISGSGYNRESDDVVVLKVTSTREKPFPCNVDLRQDDLVDGKTKNESTILVDFPITIEKGQALNYIGKISAEKLAEVKQKMRELYGL